MHACISSTYNSINNTHLINISKVNYNSCHSVIGNMKTICMRFVLNNIEKYNKGAYTARSSGLNAIFMGGAEERAEDRSCMNCESGKNISQYWILQDFFNKFWQDFGIDLKHIFFIYEEVYKPIWSNTQKSVKT